MRSAISFAIVAVGTKTASSWPSSSAARALELVDGRVLAPLLVADLGGRDRARASPASACVLVSERRSIIRTPFGASTARRGAGSAERSGCSSNR